MRRILVVQDDEPVVKELADLLADEGFRMAVATTGPSGLDVWNRTAPDVILLDLVLPELSGTEVLRKLRERSSVPVIILSARNDEVDKVVSLELGADDYVTKPFSPRELAARIRAVLRRPRDTLEDVRATCLEAGPVRIDVEAHAVMLRNTPVELPLKQFELLEFMVRHAGQVLTRMQLMNSVWSPNYVGDTKTLDVHIRRLRHRIEPDPPNPRHIVTVRGLGYRFAVGGMRRQ